MDPRRFDDMTKRLTTGSSRRQVLKGLAGGALASALSFVGAGGVVARQCRDDGKNCKSDTECCSLFCNPATFTCAVAPPADTCDPACPTGALCVDGACFCPVPTAFCPTDGCVDLQTDVTHCGTCATACATGATCTAGSCVCPTGESVCNGVCVNRNTDETNCGSCGRQCAAGTVCSSGDCCGSTAVGSICCASGNPSTCVEDYDCNCGLFGCDTCSYEYSCCR